MISLSTDVTLPGSGRGQLMRLPSLSNLCRFASRGVTKILWSTFNGASPSSRRVSGPMPSASAWTKVSDPRCSASRTFAGHSPAVVETSACSGRMPMVAAPRFSRRTPDHVHCRRADEARDEQAVRPVVEIERRADLGDRAPVEHDDLVGHGHRLDLVVGDVDHRRLEGVVQFADLDPHLHAQCRVEIAERLVEQERLRLAHDRAPDGDTLPLAAGELARLAVEIVGEVQRPLRPCGPSARSPRPSPPPS